MLNLTANTVAQDVRELIPAAQAAWLFGSVARGSAGRDSDVDVAVLFDAALPSDTWDLSKHASVLASRWGQPVDLIDMRKAPCTLQKEIIQAQHRLYANNADAVDNYELFALSQYRDYNARYAATFAHIARGGQVLQVIDRAHL